jgi:hypothetical protein
MKIHKVNLTYSQKVYVEKLELSKEFEDLVVNARKLCGLPPRGFESTKTTRSVKIVSRDYKDPSDLGLLIRASSYICGALDIPVSWVNTISSIIIFNAAFRPIEEGKNFEDIEVLSVGLGESGKKVLLGVQHGTGSYQNQLVLVARNGFGGSFEKFISALSDKRNEIEDALKSLPSHPKSNKGRTIEHVKRWMELVEKGNTHEKATDIVNDEYEGNLPIEPSSDVFRIYKDRLESDIKSIVKSSNAAMTSMLVEMRLGLGNKDK